MSEFDLEKLNQITDKVLKAKYIPKNKTRKKCDNVKVLKKTKPISLDDP